MQNGTYLVRHKVMPNLEHHLIAYNGLMKLYTKQGKFIKSYIHDIVLDDNWSIVKQLPANPKVYDIEWIVNGRTREVIRMNASYAVCVNKIAMMKPTYNIGLLRPVRVV